MRTYWRCTRVTKSSADAHTAIIGRSRWGMISAVVDIAEFVETVSEQTRRIVAGTGRAYDVGRRIWTLGMEGAADEALRDVAWPIWLIWGNLTDRVDGPRGREPGAEEAASSEMRRAASEWLAVATDQASRDVYFDRWVYEECGYDRKDPESNL